MKKIEEVGRTWWGEPQYRDLETGRPVRFTFSTGLFYYADEEGGYIFDKVEIVKRRRD